MVCLQELLALLRGHNGGEASPVLSFLLRGTLWLFRDPFAWQVARLRGLALNLGRSFDVSLVQAPKCAVCSLPHALAHSEGTKIGAAQSDL